MNVHICARAPIHTCAHTYKHAITHKYTLHHTYTNTHYNSLFLPSLPAHTHTHTRPTGAPSGPGKQGPSPHYKQASLSPHHPGTLDLVQVSTPRDDVSSHRPQAWSPKCPLTSRKQQPPSPICASGRGPVNLGPHSPLCGFFDKSA